MYCFENKIKPFKGDEKMKKVLGVLSALVVVFGLVLAANAQDVPANRSTEPEVKGYFCGKCPLGTVDCPGTRIIPGPQGSTSTAVDPSFPFDYDGKPYQLNPSASGYLGFGSYGYCSGYNFADDDTRNCKFFFDVCTCDEACKVEIGSKIGIQMYIKTSGVYFADPDLIEAGNEADRLGMPTVHFGIYKDYRPPCATNASAQPTVTMMEDSPYFLDSAGDRVGRPTSTSDAGTWVVRNFGPVEYYTKLTEVTNTKGMFESTATHQYTNEAPLSGQHTGAVPARNRVVALQSFEETDYVFNEVDIADALGNCKLWIDIPAMRVDPTVAQEGATIRLQVRLLFNRALDTICPQCNPPNVCDMTIDIGVVCCDVAVTPTGEHCMFFPYVLQGIQDTYGWATGVAISAREDEMPDNAWVELKLRDQAGNIATYKRENMGRGLVWAFVLDDEMSNFTGSLVGGATSLTVTSNYSMDGYQFLNVAGTFGAGSNARGCGPGECSPQ